MEYLYIFPLEGQPWFKLGITNKLENRIKQHEYVFSESNITFNPSDILYCECNSRHSIGHIETYIKKRFTPVQAAEIFHIDDYDQVKDLIIEYGSPLGVSDFKRFEERRRKAAVKKRKELKAAPQPPFEFQKYAFMRFKSVLPKMKEMVDLSPPAGSDILKWNVQIDLNKITKSQKEWLLKERISYHLPKYSFETDEDYTVTSCGINLQCWQLCHPFSYVDERRGDGCVITIKNCIGFKRFNIDEDNVITLEFDLEYLKLHYTEAFHNLFNLLKEP